MTEGTESRPGSGIRIRSKKNMDLDPNPVCPERLNPDPVNIRPDLKSVKDEMPREAKLSGLSQNISVDAAAGKQRQGGKLSVKQLEYNYNLCMGGLKVHTYLIVPKQFLPHNRYLILLILNKKDKSH